MGGLDQNPENIMKGIWMSSCIIHAGCRGGILEYIGGSSSRMTPGEGGSGTAPASSCCTKFVGVTTLGDAFLLPLLTRNVGTVGELGPLESKVISDALRSCRRSAFVVGATPETVLEPTDLISVDRRLDVVSTSGTTKGSG